jgi:hypothetical protein
LCLVSCRDSSQAFWQQFQAFHLIDFGFWFVVETDFKAWHNNVCNGMVNAGIVCLFFFFQSFVFMSLVGKKKPSSI